VIGCNDMTESNERNEKTAFLNASWVNVGGNTLKILVEGGIGLYFGSLALVADAAHSVADLLASVVVLIWGQLYYSEPDRNHPHGHKRIEPLTALFVGAVLIGIGVKLLYDSSVTLFHGSEVTYSVLLFVGLGVGAVLMTAVYLYTIRVNRHLNLPSLAALAKDSRNDILTSLAAMIGIVGVSAGHPWLDPAAGALVSLLMIYEGGWIGYENINYLTGAAPPEEKQEEIQRVLRSHPEVRGVHDFTCFYTGPVLEVETHVEVDGTHTLHDAHDIEEDLLNRVRALNNIYDVHIHLDPSGIGEWKDAPEPAPDPDEPSGGSR